jgi:hypothetical protein
MKITEKDMQLIEALRCNYEEESFDERVRYCHGLHPACCKDCTLNKKHTTQRIVGQRKKASKDNK